MDQIVFIDEETGEEVLLYVLEETTISEQHYLLLAEDAEGDSDAYIFREIGGDDEESTYEPVEDDVELEAVIKVFGELMDDTAFE